MAAQCSWNGVVRAIVCANVDNRKVPPLGNALRECWWGTAVRRDFAFAGQDLQRASVEMLGCL